MQTNHQTKDTPLDYSRRNSGAHGEGGARAILNMAGPEGLAFAVSGACTSYQGSAEPMRKPDHKAKRHSRPHRWEDRRAKRERQSREWPE